MKKLNELINCSYDINIEKIATDAREVQEGTLFIAVKGINIDHHDFIDDAIKRKAAAIIGTKDLNLTIPYIKVSNIDDTLFDICQKFYENPLSNLGVIGITGTDGKTTTATMLYHLLSNFITSAYIGTNGFITNKEEIKLNNTTPIIEELYKCFYDAYQSNCEIICMEASSEALLYDRLKNISFEISILTNITEDHLNVHKTIENYVKAKGKLFSATKKNGYCILNSDDLHYQEIKKISNGKIITYGKNSNSDFIIENINIYNNKTIFTLKHKYNNYVFESPYLTSYDVYNLTAAIIATNLLGASLNEIKSYIKEMPLVKGRFEIVKVPRSYKVIIDYAHTFNSIKSIINNVKKDIKGNLIVITGAAGGREKEKRREIGKFLLDNCSKVIFTMDDPRYESVFDITNDLISNSNKQNYVTIPDRMQAIYYALEIGEKDDIIIILGKGADEYMAIFDKKLPYDEKQIINSYFLNMKSPF